VVFAAMGVPFREADYYLTAFEGSGAKERTLVLHFRNNVMVLGLDLLLEWEAFGWSPRSL